MPKVPWLPKKSSFIVTDVSDPSPNSNRMPGLIPIAKQPTSQQRKSQPLDGFPDEMVQAQIRINTQAMKEIEFLRGEQMKLTQAMEKTRKENEMFKAKLMRAHDQLAFLKKKVNKNGSNVYDEEMFDEERIGAEPIQSNDEAIDFIPILVDLIEEEHIDEENVEEGYIVEEYLEDEFLEVEYIDE